MTKKDIKEKIFKQRYKKQEIYKKSQDHNSLLAKAIYIIANASFVKKSKLEALGFKYSKIGKYLGVRSKTLFILKQGEKTYFGIGTAPNILKFYEENFGMILPITKKEEEELKNIGIDVIIGG